MITLKLTPTQFGAIYEAVNHLYWELHNDGQDWGYEPNQEEALKDVASYLYKKLPEARIW